MNIKVGLTDTDVEALRRACAAYHGAPKKAAMTVLMRKLEKALDAPVVEKKAARKSSGKALWQVIGRADLKDALEPTRVVVIGGDEIRSNWRFKDPGNSEECAVCGRGLRGARLAIVNDTTGAWISGLAMAHKPCAIAHLGGRWEERHDTLEDGSQSLELTRRYSTSYQRFVVSAQPKVKAMVIKNPQVRPFGGFGLIAPQDETPVAA